MDDTMPLWGAAELATPKYSKGLYAKQSDNSPIQYRCGVPLDIRNTHQYDCKVVVQGVPRFKCYAFPSGLAIIYI